MESDLTVAYEKLVIDDEILGMNQRVLRGIEVSDDTLAVDLITDVCEEVGSNRHYLAEFHTAEHMRGVRTRSDDSDDLGVKSSESSDLARMRARPG
jgi:trimethylamine--corrinoid protein Co-methyltransferase